MAGNGFTDKGVRIQPVATYNPVTGEWVQGGGGTLAATATAAPPTYTEGQADAPLSLDLDGNLRITGTITADTAVTATNAAPTYVEGSATNPLSTNLSGDLRVIAKQSGSWTVAATQSGTWNVTNISGTVSLPTGASTAANQTSVIGTKAAGTAAANSVLTGLVYNTALPTLTNGQQAALQADSSGRLYTVAAQSGTWNIGSITTLPVAYNAGAADASTVRTITSTDDPGVAALQAIQAEAESTAPADVEEAGASYFSSGTVDETAGATSVMAGPGKLVWMHVYNPHATDTVFLHLFDATSVTLNTTEPVLRIPWKAGQAGWAKVPTAFATGLRISAHPTYAKSATAPASDLIVNAGYKLD